MGVGAWRAANTEKKPVGVAVASHTIIAEEGVEVVESDGYDSDF